MSSCIHLGPSNVVFADEIMLQTGIFLCVLLLLVHLYDALETYVNTTVIIYRIYTLLIYEVPLVTK